MLFKASQSLEPLNSGGPVSIVGSWLATTFDEDVLITDLVTGEHIARFSGDGESISALALAPDHSVVVAASRSLQIHVWSLETLKKVKTFPKAHESFVLAMTIDPTSTLVGTGGSEGAVKVWDLREFYQTHNFRGHGGPISCLSFWGRLGSPEWRLASGSEDSKVRVWDLVSAKCIKVWENHVNVVRSVAWTSTGDGLLSGGRDKVLSIYRGNGGTRELAAILPTNREVEAAGFVAGHIFSASPSAVQIWSLEGKVVVEWATEADAETEIIDVLRTGDTTLTAILSDQTLVELNVSPDTGAVAPGRFLSTNHGEIIDVVALTSESPENADQQFALATNSHEIRIIDLSKPLEFRPLRGHTDIVIAIDVLGPWLASAGKDKEARLWNVQTGECKLTMSGHTGSIGAVALSRIGSVPQFVITGSSDLTIKKWAASGDAEYTRKAHDKDINSLDVSRDNKFFATGSQDRTIKVWRVDNGEVIGLLRGHRRGVWNVRFAPENTLISGSGDRTVRQWSLNDMSCLRTFEGHTNSVLKVMPYLGSNNVASAGGDGLIKVWDPRTSECVATLDGHEDKVWALTTTRGSGQLVSGGGDGVLRVWQDYTEQEQARIDEETEAQLELQQSLDTSVRNAEWEKAISLALELNHPLRLYKLFGEIAEHREPESVTGLETVDAILGSLDRTKMLKLLIRVRDWNTTSRTSATAQTVLHALLTKQPQSALWDPEVIQMVEGILAYSQRHRARTEELLQTSYALDYALKEMSLHI